MNPNEQQRPSKVPQREKIPVPHFRWEGLDMTMQRMDPSSLHKYPGHVSLRGIHTEMRDQDQALWAGLTAIAEDLYSRQPEGSRKFEKLAQVLGLQLNGFGDRSIMVAEKLAAIQPKSQYPAEVERPDK